MKPEMRLAGLFASLTFLGIGLGGYLSTMAPLQSMLYGIAASITMAYIGYKIGFIVAHPQGRKKHNAAHTLRKFDTAPSMAGQGEETLTPLTGEETFLDDVES